MFSSDGFGLREFLLISIQKRNYSFMVASSDRLHDSNIVEHIWVRYEYAIQDVVTTSRLMHDLSESSLFHQILVGQFIPFAGELNMCQGEVTIDLLDAQYNIFQ